MFNVSDERFTLTLLAHVLDELQSDVQLIHRAGRRYQLLGLVLAERREPTGGERALRSIRRPGPAPPGAAHSAAQARRGPRINQPAEHSSRSLDFFKPRTKKGLCTAFFWFY